MGPALIGGSFSSADIIKALLLKEWPALPLTQIMAVDVRDVAEAHLNAITIPEAAGHRFILCESCYWFKDIADFLRESHGKDYPNIP